MGNRAIIKFKNGTPKTAIYLHWNGGPESVLAFLKTQVDRGWTRDDYAEARFCAIVTEFFDQEGNDQGLSLGIQRISGDNNLDSPGDNGVYEVELKNDIVRQYEDENTQLTWSISQPIFTHDSNAKKYQGIIDLLSRLRANRKKTSEIDAEQSLTTPS